jgi:hypothetical protein
MEKKRKCDACGKEKTGKFHPVYNENWIKTKRNNTM